MDPRALRASAAALLVAGLAVPAMARTIVVPPGPGTPIQDAMDIAKPGDTIALTRGTYRENIVVQGIDGLRFVGRGRPVWDGFDSASGQHLPCLDVTGNGIFVQGIRFQNGDPQLRITGNDARVRKCTFRGAGGDAVVITGDRATVERCTVRGARGEGVVVTGMDANVSRNHVTQVGSFAVHLADGVVGAVFRNRIRNVASTAVWLSGPSHRSTVFRNRIDGCAGEGVFTEGEDTRIERNIVHAAGSGGVEVYGARTVIVRNRVDVSGADGIYLGDTPGSQVEDNRVSHVAGEGLHLGAGVDVMCFDNRVSYAGGAAIDANGDGVAIIGNAVFGTSNDDFGISYTGAVNGGTVVNNRVTEVGFYAYYFFGVNDVTIHGNTAMSSGSGDKPNFYIGGDRNSVHSNRAIDASDDGFHVFGDDNLLISNMAKDCGRDGFDIDSGTANTVMMCTASGCGGEGLDNGADGTDVTFSRFQRNRIDVANDGTFGRFADNNVFSTGGDATPQQVD